MAGPTHRQQSPHCAEMPCIKAIILKHRLRWSGHVSGMDPLRHLRTILYSKFSRGKQHPWPPEWWYKDQLKSPLLQAGTTLTPGKRKPATVHNGKEQFILVVPPLRSRKWWRKKRRGGSARHSKSDQDHRILILQSVPKILQSPTWPHQPDQV